MADVHHIHHDTDVDRTDSGVAMLVFTLIAILAVAAFAFFAFNGTLFRSAAPASGGSDINVQGTIDVPTPAPTPSTNQGGNTNVQ